MSQCLSTKARQVQGPFPSTNLDDDVRPRSRDRGFEDLIRRSPALRILRVRRKVMTVIGRDFVKQAHHFGHRGHFPGCCRGCRITVTLTMLLSPLLFVSTVLGMIPPPCRSDAALLRN